MKLSNIILLTSLIISGLLADSFAQDTRKVPKKVRNGFWITPSRTRQINGIAIGPFESSILNEYQTINGLTISLIGMGIFWTMASGHNKLDIYYKRPKNKITIDSMLLHDDSLYLIDIRNHYIHRGVVVGGAGTLSDKVQGICIGGIASFYNETDGIIINSLVTRTLTLKGISFGVFNESYLTKGIQIGVINRSVRLRGIQIGLWNMNLKRSLPFFNWNFKKE